MSHTIQVELDVSAEQSVRTIHPLRIAEDAALALTLGGLMLLPAADILMRWLFQTGIGAESAIVEHLTLIVGMLGAAVAARENRLLGLSSLGTSLKGKLRSLASVFSAGCAGAISIALCIAGVQFVLALKPSSATLAYRVPLWLIQTILPIGFGIVAWRLIWRSAESVAGRVAATAVAAGLVVIGAYPPIAPEQLVIPALLALFAATVLGIPIFGTLGGVAVILFWGSGVPIASISTSHYFLVRNSTIATVPLFTLAGYFLAESGAAGRLVRVFHALFGPIPGGSAIVTALVCAFFTSFTGGSGVTIIALGGLLMPVLRAERFSEKASLGLVTGAGSLGLLLPPCLPLILYAIVANVPIESMFLAGILPSSVMIGAVAWWGAREGRRSGVERDAFRWAGARRALWEAKWELTMPVLAWAALFGGYASPVEAAALTALYAFVIEAVIHRDLKFHHLRRVFVECGLLMGGVLVILGVALGLTNYLVHADITAQAVEWTTRNIHSRWVFLLVLNLFLLVVGCLMDIYSAIVIQVPLLVRIAEPFQIDPLHLGIIFLANLELGYLTPPVGLNLFLSSYRFGKPVPEVLRAVAPIVIVMFITVLLITYVPWLTTAIPSWAARN